MVKTTEAREFANATDLKDNAAYTIEAEFRVRESKSDPNDPKSAVRKRLFGKLKEIDLPVILNNGSRVALEKGFGTETKDWIGKKIRVSIIEQQVQGTPRSVCYFKPA